MSLAQEQPNNAQEILINVTPSETRVARVENGMLQEVQLERATRRGWVGNLYKGRVTRVLPGMQAAFVDIGLERTAFLHASDISNRLLTNEANEPNETDEAESGQSSTPDITTLVHEGQELLVQVIKDPLGSKGARLTTSVSLPSRYLVLLPNSRQIGVSVRIEEEAERERLREIMRSLREGESPGYIVRTNAELVNQEALAADVLYLNRLWEEIQERIGDTKPGELVYGDLPLFLRALRDQLGARVEKVRIDSRRCFDDAVRFAQRFMPDRVSRIEHYGGQRPIFDLYGVEDEIQRALRRRVSLKSGGHLVIDQTESMTTIDVNTGGFVGHRNLEDTIFKTNLEAAQAIARQLRLRNLGGIIIIDFIDMETEDHRQQVLRMLERCLADDHAKTQISQLSPLGLVEMTRKRITESLEHIVCEPCPTCSGRGSIKTAETVAYEIFREITRAVRQFDAEKLMVIASPRVVEHILDEESTAVAELEQFIDKSISFKAEDQYSQEQYDVVLL
jgi:ribonuclease G